MRNTWMHSLALVAVMAPTLGVSLAFSAHANQEWVEPARVFALLLPGLVLGWFTRRHPLLVGGAAGVLAVACSGQAGSTLPTLLAVAMTVAVAALAGRALRYRFRPVPIAPLPDRAPGS